MNAHLTHFQLQTNPFPVITEDLSEERFLPEDRVGAYIDNQLQQAGRNEPLFDGDAFPIIYSSTKGDPRLIHTICDFALNRAFFLKQTTIPKELLTESLELIIESNPPDTYEDDKRRHKRVRTSLSGNFVVQSTKTRGMMTVTNISRNGLQIKLGRQRMLKIKDMVNLNFKLDDPEQSDIRTQVMVRHTFGFFAGCAFRHSDNISLNQYLEKLLKKEQERWAKISL